MGGPISLIILAWLVVLQSSPPQEAPPSWTEAIDPVQIADGVYYVGTAGLASYLITSGDGHILIDAPMGENTQLVLSNIRRLEFEPSDIRIQLATRPLRSRGGARGHAGSDRR